MRKLSILLDVVVYCRFWRFGCQATPSYPTRKAGFDLSASRGWRITLVACTTAPQAQMLSVRPVFPQDRLSRYRRMLSGLPWQRIPITLRLHVRRFFCDESSCNRTIFAEWLPEPVGHYARRTNRLDDWLTHVS